MLISVDQLEESAKRYASLPNQVVRDFVSDLSDEAFISDLDPKLTKGNILSTDENLARRKEMLETVQQEPVEFAFERAIGKNDSVYSNFIELMRNAKQKVGRIAVKRGSQNLSFATGFMVSGNLLLTNWHVFKTINDVGDSEIQFLYEYDTSGNPETPVSFKLRSDIFYHSSQVLDYCFVGVNATDITGNNKLTDFGYIFLDPALGKLGSEDEEALNIIHHPDGDYMQLSIRENLFVKITPTSIWYQTDTAPGSSGSPVFNDQWQVVALHHMGVGKKNDAGEYVDKDGRVIPLINGKIDASKVVWVANEGIRISVILKDLFLSKQGNTMLDGLRERPIAMDTSERQTRPPKLNISNNTSNMEQDNLASSVSITFPSSLMEKNGMVNISISQGEGVTTAAAPQRMRQTPTTEQLDLEEIKKLEESTDFSSCKGYQSKFLGSHLNIPLPQPQQSIRKFIAKVGNTDSIVLRYYNYSTIFNSLRMMPVISGINVNGDLSKRMDTTPRKDTWLRDTRLSFDIQMDDTYYKGSGFDRGHMSRREDANWGSTAEDAKRNADLTCMYTNACPQVAKLNQSGKKGLWGILEKIVLEKGASAEQVKTAKISVFNGPIFKDDDPVFRGIQIPMDFYKIVLWLTDDGALRATAFRLSQVNEINEIDFEQLDLDQNTKFKEFQCSIKSLQKDTRMDFSDVLEFDTFEDHGAEELALNSEFELMAHIDKYNKN